MSTSDSQQTVRAARQVNLGLGDNSPLRARLLEAQSATGRSFTRIVREVLEDYLGLWLSAQLREQRVIAEARRHIDGDHDARDA